MVSPEFISEQPVTLAETKTIIKEISERDEVLNYITNKSKDFLDICNIASDEVKNKLQKKLEGLDLTRLKQEHIVKIIDFLPTTVNDLKVILQAYPLSMPKKDQDAIVATVKEIIA